MTGERAAIFGQLIERLEESEVSPDDRKEVYEIMLDILEEFDVKGVNSYLNIDPSFDEVYNERYPEIDDEEE